MQLTIAEVVKARPGRPRRKGEPEYVLHRTRPFVERSHPLHVTWKMVRGLPNLRGFEYAGIIGRTIREANARNARRRSAFGVIHFSIQGNHLHMIVEAGDRRSLTRELRGLGVWIARRLNQR